MTNPDDESPETTTGPRRHAIPLVWGDVESVPVLFANQIPFGVATPPVVVGVGDIAEQDRALAAIDHVMVRPIARINVGLLRLQDIALLLAQTVRKLESLPKEDE